MANLASFADDTAEKTGRGSRSVRRDAARAEHIPELDKVVGTSLDNGEELDALAKLAPEEQAPLIERAASGEAVSARSDEYCYAFHTFSEARRYMVNAWEAWVATDAPRADVADQMLATWEEMSRASGIEEIGVLLGQVIADAREAGL
jgi:hypothetical protein